MRPVESVYSLSPKLDSVKSSKRRPVDGGNGRSELSRCAPTVGGEDADEIDSISYCYHTVTKNRGKERKAALRVGGLSFLSSIAYLSNLMGGSLFLLPDGTPYHVDSMLFPCLPYVKTAQQATTSVVFEQGMREVIGMKRAFPDIM